MSFFFKNFPQNIVFHIIKLFNYFYLYLIIFDYTIVIQTGVMQLLSKCASFGFSGGKDVPLSVNSERIFSISLIFSVVSFDARNRRDLC